MVHDTATGSDRALTPNKSWADGPYAEFSAISRDGKQVAYAWFDAKNECELRVAPLDGSGVPSSRLLYRNPGEVDDIAPYDWSADGRWIAVHLRMKDFSGRIALVSAADGALRVLKSTDWKGPSKIFFSPDSRYIAYDLPVSDTKENTDVFVMALEGSRETPVVVHPAEDVVMGWSPEGGYLLFASDRTGRMCLWGLPVADGKARGPAEMLKPDTGEPWSLGVTDAGAMYVFKLVGGFEVQVAGIDLARGRVSGPQPNLGLTKLDARPANWSRDGKYLSYVWCKTGSGNCKLFIRSMETGELRQVRRTANR
jgi:Tol biopolymer transport system component